MEALRLTCLLVLFPAAPATEEGVAYNANFTVRTTSQKLADEVLTKAETLRRDIALAWLNEELPAGEGPATIYIRLSQDEDRALTWPMDNPQRTRHVVWLTTTRERAVSSALAHEITHTVFATRFGDALPAWADEGIASLEDDASRVQVRRRTMGEFARSGWPSLRSVLDQRTISPTDRIAHSTATSLTEFLLTRADKPTLLEFAVAGKSLGWDAALKQHYRIRSVDELTRAWQRWAAQALAARRVIESAGRVN
jgi:hypothetical protein